MGGKGGVVEADETNLGTKEGRRVMARVSYKREILSLVEQRGG
jgi:hypothetical protein